MIARRCLEQNPRERPRPTSTGVRDRNDVAGDVSSAAKCGEVTERPNVPVPRVEVMVSMIAPCRPEKRKTGVSRATSFNDPNGALRRTTSK